MKKIISMILVLALVFTSVVSFADEGREIKVFVDGQQLEFDVPPTSENGRTLVPMRYIFEALGATVSWQGDVNTVLATKGDTVVALQPGQGYLFKNSEKVEMPVASIAKDNRILVPIRAIAEAFDTDVFYNGNTKTVVIH